MSREEVGNTPMISHSPHSHIRRMHQTHPLCEKGNGKGEAGALRVESGEVEKWRGAEPVDGGVCWCGVTGAAVMLRWVNVMGSFE